ncbi:unnamed protein product, partial [Brassica oleracea]
MASRKFEEEDEEDRSIRLQVSELHKLEEARGSNDTVFDLRSSIEKGDSGETADAASVSSTDVSSDVSSGEEANAVRSPARDPRENRDRNRNPRVHHHHPPHRRHSNLQQKPRARVAAPGHELH